MSFEAELAAGLTSFALLFLSEVADKTQLIILGLALRYRAPLQVWLGALSAHALMDLLAILVGAAVGFAVPDRWIAWVVGAVFVLLGAYALFVPERHKARRKVTARAAVIASFLAVALSEFGDKSQITAGLLAAKYRLALPVFLGTLFALALAIGLNVFIGSRFADRLPRARVRQLSGALFVLFGLLFAFL